MLERYINMLKKLEWSARYSSCTGWTCCPICHGIKPGHGADEHGNLPINQGHREHCELMICFLHVDNI